jgi:hypothetical protein
VIEIGEKHTDTNRALGSDPGMVPRSPKLRRRPLLIALAVVLTVAGAIGGSVLWRTATSATEVVMVRQDVARGELITAADVGTVRMATDPSLKTVAATELGSLVGKRAAADLTAGTLLSPAEVSDAVVPGPGESLMGVPIAAGMMPAEPLKAGDTVRLVPSGDSRTATTGSTDPISAKVLRTTPGDTQTVVDVIVPTAQGPTLAGWMGAGRIVLILESRAR